MSLKPCKHLDHNPDNYPSCELKVIPAKENGSNVDVLYFYRKNEVGTGNPLNVQFCKQRGRMNSIFDCYQKECMNCYETN